MTDEQARPVNENDNEPEATSNAKVTRRGAFQNARHLCDTWKQVLRAAAREAG